MSTATLTCKLYIFKTDDGRWIAEDPYNISNRIEDKSFNNLLDRLTKITNKRRFGLL